MLPTSTATNIHRPSSTVGLSVNSDGPTIPTAPTSGASSKQWNTGIFYISFLILVLSDGAIVGITISITFLSVPIVAILIIMVILIFKGQYYLVMNCYINTLCTCVCPLVCRTKQSRGETRMVGQYTINNTNSDTVSTANVASTIVDASQTQSTVATAPYLCFQDTQPDPPPYTAPNVPVQPVANNFRPNEIGKEKKEIGFRRKEPPRYRNSWATHLPPLK